MTPLEEFAAKLDRFTAYYLETRPLARQMDPLIVRRICAETLLDRERRGEPSGLDAPPPIPDVFIDAFRRVSEQ